MPTLNEIAGVLNVSPNTVRNKIERYKTATGIDFYAIGQKDPLDSRSIVYPQEAVDDLIAFIQPDLAEVPKVVVEDGNHRESREITVSAESTSLEQFRTDRIRQQLANPQEFMAGLNGVLDQIEDGMDRAEAHQEQELTQLRLTKRQAQRRIEQFRRRADEYKLKTDILASIQNDELDQLADLADEANSLGKPSAG